MWWNSTHWFQRYGQGPTKMASKMATNIIEKSRDITPRLKYEKSKGHRRSPLCPKYGAILTSIHGVMAFWKHWRSPFFFDRPPSWKCRSHRTGFRTSPSPEWKKANRWKSVRFRFFFISSYRVNVTSCNILWQGKGARSQRANNRTEPFPVKIGRWILNLVALALTVTELFNKVWQTIARCCFVMRSYTFVQPSHDPVPSHDLCHSSTIARLPCLTIARTIRGVARQNSETCMGSCFCYCYCHY